MADEDSAARTKALLEAYDAGLRAGEPMMTIALHEILRTVVLPTGEVLVDFVFGKSPDNRAVVARLVMELESAQKLKAAPATNENIPDTPPAAPGQKSMN